MAPALFDIINNLSFTGWVVLTGSILALFLSAVIYWQDTKKRSSKFFLIFGLVNAFWGWKYALFEGSLNIPGSTIDITMLYILASLAPLSFFFFLRIFADEKIQISFKKYLALCSPFLVFLLVFNFAPSNIVSFNNGDDGSVRRIILGKWFFLYAIYILGYISAGFIVLLRKYSESAGIFKTTIRRLVFTAFFASIGVILGSLSSPFFFQTHDLFWIGHISIILLIIAASFILARYNFWNLKIIATDFFIAIIVSILVLELFIATSVVDLLVKTGIALLVVFSSSFLADSVKREIQSKDKIARLLHDLDLASKRLKILDEKKSEFLSIASHHLRDPLTAIKGYASMLTEGSFGDLSRQVGEAVEKIFTSSGHLITMISDFMDISRIESGDMNYNFKDVDMKKLVTDLADGMKQNADRSGLGFHLVVDNNEESASSYITVGDAGKLRQVISNLMDNAIKYTPAGDVYIALSKTSNGKKILLSITDNGIGMSDMTKEKIFNKFSRAEGVSKVYTEGTGLGLYVAKEVIKKHEGRIWAESRGEGTGSSFYVELETKH